MRKILTLMTVLAAALFQDCFGLTEKERKFATANNDFAFALLKTIPSYGSKNVFFSPYSLSAALGMTYLGARESTQFQLSKVLGYANYGLHAPDVEELFAMQTSRLQGEAAQVGLDMANGLAVQEDFRILETYYAAVNRSFNAHLLGLDFAQNGQQAVDTINAWVKQATHDKVEKLFEEPLDTDTRLVLLNAIVFKGLWEIQFKRELTTKRMFYNGGGDRTEVDLMNLLVKTNYVLDASLQAHVVELPYRGVDYSMVIMLPVSDRNSLQALKEFLTFASFDAVVSSLRNTTIDFYLPKFDLESQMNLRSDLIKLGLKRIFDEPFSYTDLSGITGTTDLVVSDVVQRAVLKVDEDGAEVADGSGVNVISRGEVEPPTVIVNRPFLFFIRNRSTKEIFFAGEVNKL
ncbi:iripin-2-like [Haemaphysalis longicornis]